MVWVGQSHGSLQKCAKCPVCACASLAKVLNSKMPWPCHVHLVTEMARHACPSMIHPKVPSARVQKCMVVVRVENGQEGRGNGQACGGVMPFYPQRGMAQVCACFFCLFF